MWEQVAAVVSVSIAVVSIIGSWLAWRRAELKSDDVLNWSMRVINALQTITLLTDPKFKAGDDAVRRLGELAVETSVLAETGRLFFKNNTLTLHGRDKRSAYRGYRTVILDQIIIAHQVARSWGEADGEARLRLHVVAGDCTKEFVSLAQKEIGRSRTASVVTKKGGSGEGLDVLLAGVSAERLAGFSPHK